MKTITKNIFINAPSEKVFTFMDNLGNTGMHMMNDSKMMMGSKLELEQISKNPTGLNSKYHWHGKIMGMIMDFTVLATKWVKNKEKTWETIESPKMIILEWYKMSLKIFPEDKGTRAMLSISYTKPKNVSGKILGFLLAKWYAKWCVNSMLKDSKKALESI